MSRTASVTTRPFKYEAIDTGGALQIGEVLASSERQALVRLRHSGVRPMSIRRSRVPIWRKELRLPFGKGAVKTDDLALTARQFATMISAGISLTRCLSVLAEQTRNPLLARTLAEVRTAVVSGESLSAALSCHPAIFDRLFVAMVRAGETAGALDIVLTQLAATLERSAAVKRKIRSAMTYPVAVLVMVTLIITVMLVFIVPVFSGIYADLGGTLPLPTRILVGLSDLFTTRLPVVLGAVGIGTFAGNRWKKSHRGARAWDAMKLRIPLIGKLFHKSAMARLGRTLAVLTRSGVPVLEALRISADTTGNVVVTDGLNAAMAAVGRGERLASSLANESVFPPMVVQLVAVGEETGSVDEMLEVIGKTFESEVEVAVDGLAATIEPLLMAFIGCVVGTMVVALYLPMFRIIDLVQ